MAIQKLISICTIIYIMLNRIFQSTHPMYLKKNYITILNSPINLIKITNSHYLHNISLEIKTAYKDLNNAIKIQFKSLTS
jgi:hypothetical protein